MPTRPTFRAFAFVLFATMSGTAMAEGEPSAREAIADARAKIATVTTLGAGAEVPQMVADAQAALRSAQADLKAGNSDGSLANASLAAELADTAIEVTQPSRERAAAVRRARADIARQAAQVAAMDRAQAERRIELASANGVSTGQPTD